MKDRNTRLLMIQSLACKVRGQKIKLTRKGDTLKGKYVTVAWVLDPVSQDYYMEVRNGVKRYGHPQDSINKLAAYVVLAECELLEYKKDAGKRGIYYGNYH